MRREIITLILAILLAQAVVGIGVGPAITKIDFEPDLTSTYRFTIYNTDAQDFTASLRLEGELDEYLEIESSSASFTTDTQFQVMTFDVSFPRDIPPGDYEGRISILQNVQRTGGQIGVALGISHDVALHVPAHGKYVKEFITRDDEKIKVDIKNIGLQEIENLESINNIYDAFGNITTKDARNNFQADDILTRIINIKKLSPGIYTHDLTIYYDELTKEVSNEFQIGRLEVSIEDWDVDNFLLGAITRVDIDLESNWNQEVELYAVFEIWDENAIITQGTGPNFNLIGTDRTAVFFDSANLHTGEYLAKINIFKDGEIISTLEQTITVTEESINAKDYIDIIAKVVILLIILVAIFMAREITRDHKEFLMDLLRKIGLK